MKAADPSTRTFWQALQQQLRIRARHAAQSGFGSRVFLTPTLSGYPPLAAASAPTIDPATLLALKLLWASSGFFKQNRLLQLVYMLGACDIHEFLHKQAYQRVLRACQEQGSPARALPLPTYDWQKGCPEDFHRRFVQRPHPVVLRGFASDTRAVQAWSFQHFLARYGAEPVLVTSPQQDGVDGHLHDVNDPTRYVHNCETIFRRHPNLLDDLALDRLAPYIRKQVAFSQLFMGRAGTGSPFHAAAVWNFFTMVEGTKTWYFVDPAHSAFVYPLATLGRAAAVALCLYPDEYSKEHFPAFEYCPYYEVTLQPGDVLLNPPWWWHAVRNPSATSIGVASRWHQQGQVGIHDLMTEEDYAISPYWSWQFFAGYQSLPFLHRVLRHPSPLEADGSTMRERKNRYVDMQRRVATHKILGRRMHL